MATFLQRLAARTFGLATPDDVQRVAESIGRDGYATGAEPGFTLISSSPLVGVTGVDLQRMQLEAQRAWIMDPLIKQAVRVKRNFVLGGGITFTAEDPDIDAALRDFWRDEREQMATQLADWFNSLATTDELCLRFYPSLNGRMAVRMIPVAEIVDVITDPDDRNVVQYVWHRYTRRVFDPQALNYQTQLRDELIPGEEILWVSINRPPGGVRSIPSLTAAVPWARAYSEWLQDRAKLNKAKGAWAWIRKVIGAASAVTGAAGKLASAIGGQVRSSGSSDETSKPPPKAGSVITTNGNVEWDVINAKIGADDAASDGRALKLQVAAATNVFEHYFGDASVANLASAQAMELPMRKEYEFLQQLLGRILHQVFRKALQALIDAGRLAETYKVKREVLRDGGLAEETVEKTTIDCPIDINWPALRQEDLLPRTQAAQIQQEMGVKSDATIASELGVDDWEQERARLYKERQERQAQAKEDISQQYPPFAPQQQPQDPNAQGGDA